MITAKIGCHEKKEGPDSFAAAIDNMLAYHGNQDSRAVKDSEEFSFYRLKL
jgi:hypothetical protein